MVRDIQLIQDDTDEFSAVIALDKNNQARLEVYKLGDAWYITFEIQAREIPCDVMSQSWDGKLVSVVDDETDGIAWDRAVIERGQAGLRYPCFRPTYLTIGDQTLALVY